MALKSNMTALVALNVTRTRVTALAFNLTIISVMLSIKAGSGEFSGNDTLPHLSSTVALLSGFCITVLGLWWLLVSQNQDTEVLSRPWPFTFGAITTYLALSQTTSAFMHEYLVCLKTGVHDAEKAVSLSHQGLIGLESLGDAALLVLLIMGAAIWFLVTYVAPLIVVLKAPFAGRRAWVFLVYYLVIQVPIFWVNAAAEHLTSVAEHSQTSLPVLFAYQFFQPLLWLS